jgi:glycosyltransferase involved in cell wall biosynthesis
MISRSLRQANAVTVGSRSLAEIATRFPKTTPEIVPLGVDRGMFHPGRPTYRKRDGAVNIAIVGSLVPVKGHEIALRAVAGLVSNLPPWRLEIVGDGPLEADLRRLAAGLSIEQKVTFSRAVDHHELPEVYRRADLVLVPSYFESQCLVALEAAACGTVVAGTRVGILPEIALGNTVSPGKVSFLDELLSRLLTELHGELPNSELDPRFYLENTVPALLSLYERVR